MAYEEPTFSGSIDMSQQPAPGAPYQGDWATDPAYEASWTPQGGYYEGALPNTGGGVTTDPRTGTIIGSGQPQTLQNYYDPRVYAPTDYSGQDRVQAGKDAEAKAQFDLMDRWRSTMAPSGGGGAGGGGFRAPTGLAAQQPQQIGLGKPERTLYDLYSSRLQDPSSFSQDPAYKFLFNQGMQAYLRSRAASGMRLAGSTDLGAMKYGEDLTHTYLKGMLPEYGAGAKSELERYMGPAGLLPEYANVSNRAINQAGQSQAAQQLLPYYQTMMGSGYGGGYAPPPAWGGYGGGYNTMSDYYRA